MLAKRNILSAGLLFTVLALWSQETAFVASAPATVKAGDQFQFTVEGNEQGSIQFPETDNFELLAGPFSSFSSSTQWVNGKMTKKTTASYTYILRAGSTGDFTIPPVKVKVKREVYETNPVQITVSGTTSGGTGGSGSAGGASAASGEASEESSRQPVFLKVLPSRTSVYVGEQFVSELKVYTSVNTRPSGGLKEVPYEGFYKHALEADQTSSRENIGGKMHVTQVLQRHVLIPQKTGKLVIEPFESEWTIPQRVGGQQGTGSMFDEFFNDPFFDRYQDVPVKIATRPVTINVKPLPPNAPSGFTGAVGDFKFSAKLSADQVQVNDALSLVVTISGTGNVSLLGAPRIDFPPDHDIYETTKSTKLSTSGNRVSGTVTFEYPVVARHAGSFRIAPVSFSWFDPASGKYRTATTEEFIFTVAKEEGTDQGGQIYIPGSRGEMVENIGTDILDIRRNIPEFVTIGASPLKNTVYWLLYIILFVLFLTAVTIFRLYFKRKADVRLLRNRKASKMAKRRLRIADKARKSNEQDTFFEETEKAIWGYLSDKLTIEPSSLSRERVLQLLGNAGVQEETLTELTRIIDECEYSRYAPSSERSDMNTLYRDAARLLHILDQNIRVR
jgi:hypothetical protein